MPGGQQRTRSSGVKAVLGPTNTGKTHLAIERLCAHSSGAIGFPLRLLAREVYDRVCAIKGANRVALITGEERIEPRDARWLLCTAEAMPVTHGDHAFVAIDEAQLAGDRERGHIFTDRLLHARGRDETMILGSETLGPLVRSLVPEAEVIGRPRFSTLTHAGARKLSRIPPRSAIVAFSSEQVYAIAELLRRFRGGAAVVMGALSPQTRNAQVALYQSGEVDYLVATDAIGMGLNLDVSHVAFAGLTKFDGVRQRRLTAAEMAQIAGRAGRHQQDGSFGTLAGTGSHDASLTDDEVYAIEEHRFAPLTRLHWRNAEPRFDSLATLIGDLEEPPDRPELAAAPETIDLAVLKRLAEDPAIAATVTSAIAVARFWDVCSLPDFRQQGAETHARFVARLWQDLRAGQLGADYVAQAIAQLDTTSGDIDTLQGRIAAIRSWAYIAQRPDWVLARDEMAARARGVEARLSDALHARLTERFVNRRTAILMKRLGRYADLMSFTLDGNRVLVEEQHIGTLDGFRFSIDPGARHADRKLLLATAERHVPALLEKRAEALTAAIAQRSADITLTGGAVIWEGRPLYRLAKGRGVLSPRLLPDSALDPLSGPVRNALMTAVGDWLGDFTRSLAPLRKLEEACADTSAGPELRALLIRLVESGGMVARDGSGIDRLGKEQRTRLAQLGVRVGALDLFVAPMLRSATLRVWRDVAQATQPGTPLPDVQPDMPPVLPARSGQAAAGYRRAGKQLIRLDMAEKLLREVHAVRANCKAGPFVVDPAMAVSMGMATASFASLLRKAGFVPLMPRQLARGIHGPPEPLRWRWRPRQAARSEVPHAQVTNSSAFASLAELVR